ncbi:PREDICTED: leucine-rich repeat flightless-interacting protein 1 isoform X25 [Chinchilla lanigera]|uniref:leucine-rich repeat flightless-interacting protein 1 isoform X25 n=1 Tax=Chinchilla lanigera TaxID=34839 RepID=UPI000698916F|nr:PREDICTED: leucine-rich repeat flightless-interacting protein 1 isoform X25 [Chinchilla lanigera]
MPRALTKPTSVCAPALGPVPAPSSLARPLLCFPATKKSAVRSPRPSAQTSPPGSRPQTGPSAAAGLMNPPAGMLRARTVSVAEKPRDAGRSGTGSGTSPEWISGSWPRLGYAVSGSGGNLERAAARPPVPSPRQQPARPGPRGATPSAASTQGPPGGRQAEARLAAKRAARAEAREIRMKELERQQKEEDSERYSRRSRRLASASDEDERLSVGSRGSLRVEERPEKDFSEKGSRNMPSLSAATLASLGGTSSRRGSGDTSISIDTEASMREIKDSLAEVEEKYKKAMVSNAQLDNEKTNFMYQVDTLKDVLLELEEELAEARRQCEDKSKELERERHAHSVLQFQLAEVKEALRQRDEMLEKHGIILNSEVATNGETSDTLNNVGHPGSTKMTTEEINALKSSGDGTLGRAKEVKVENEIVENVGKRAILQNTEREQHKEDTVRDGVGIQVSHPGESAEGQTAFEDFTNAECKEQVQSRGPENCETPGQVGSQEATVMPVEGTEASLGQPKCPEDLGSGAPGPGHSQDACHALGGTEQSEKPVERQDQENQGLKTDVEEFHPKLCGGSAPVQGAQVERMSCADPGGPGGDHTEEELEAGGGAAGAPESHPGNPPVGELDSGTGHSSEKALTEQEAAEPGEAPAQSAEVGREDSVEDEGDVEKKDEKLVQTEAQTVPGAPTAQNGQEEAPGPGRADTDREPNEGKSNHQAEASDSSQKKSKSKKKKNKKKKSPAPIESLEDVKKELTYQNAEEGEAQEECRQFASKKPAAEAQEEGTDNALQSVVPGSGEGDDRPEAEVDGKLNQEDEDVEAEGEGGAAAGDAVDFAGSSAPSLGTNAGEKEGVEVVTNSSSTETAGVPPEVEDAEGTGSSLQHNAGPSGAIADACETGSPESCVTSQQQRQPVLEAAGSGSLEKGDLSEPTGEPGDLSAESGGREKGGSERGKGKEDCTMS